MVAAPCVNAVIAMLSTFHRQDVAIGHFPCKNSDVPVVMGYAIEHVAPRCFGKVAGWVSLPRILLGCCHCPIVVIATRWLS